jgi:tetratricopeptide (TPR) repeat protein
VADKWPNGKNAINSRREIAYISLDADDLDTARQEIDGIVNVSREGWPSPFAGTNTLPAELYNIALRLGEKGLKADAIKLHQYNADKFPKEAAAMRSQAQVVQLNIKDGNNAGAEAAYSKLLDVFKGRNGLSDEINRLIDCCIDVNNYEKAQQYSQYIIDTWPKTGQSLNAQIALAKISYNQDKLEAANSLLDKILAENRNDGSIAEKVFVLGEGYYDKGRAALKDGKKSEAEGHLKKTLLIWENAAKQLPDSMLFTKHAAYYSGVCYRRELLQPAKALEYYQMVVKKWPDYENAWSAQTMIGACYRQMNEHSEISKQQAEDGIMQAYDAVLEKYSNCPMAKAVCLELAKMNYEKGRLERTADIYQIYLDKYPQDDRWLSTLAELGSIYEQLQKPSAAIELYNTYIETTNQDDPKIQTILTKIETLKKGVEK